MLFRSTLGRLDFGLLILGGALVATVAGIFYVDRAIELRRGGKPSADIVIEPASWRVKDQVVVLPVGLRSLSAASYTGQVYGTAIMTDKQGRETAVLSEATTPFKLKRVGTKTLTFRLPKDVEASISSVRLVIDTQDGRRPIAAELTPDQIGRAHV